MGAANRQDPIVIPRDSEALYLLQQVRDEAHRFAITYHRMLRSKRTIRSTLDGVPGVGPARRRALLTAFGSVAELAAADAPAIAARARVPLPVAERVVAHLRAGAA